MQYPDYFTADNIMEFDYQYNSIQDEYWEINAELQLVAQKQQAQITVLPEVDH